MMTTDTLLAATAGAGIAAGATLATCGLLGYPRAGGRAPPRGAGQFRRGAFGPRAVTRAVAAGLVAGRAYAAPTDTRVGQLMPAALVRAGEVRGRGLHAVLTELASDVARDITGRREVEAARASYRSSLTGTVLLMAGFLVFLVLNR